MKKEKNKGGRPLKFKTVEKLQKKIDEYFSIIDRERINGKFFRPYTITGLALHLDTSRETLCNYEKKDKYFDAIKRAKQRVEEQLEEGLYRGQVTGLIFNLKNNFGWKDKTETDITSGGKPLPLLGGKSNGESNDSNN